MSSVSVQFTFLHSDQAQNTLSGIQGQETMAVAVIYVTAPTVYENRKLCKTTSNMTMTFQQGFKGTKNFKLSTHSLSSRLCEF